VEPVSFKRLAQKKNLVIPAGLTLVITLVVTGRKSREGLGVLAQEYPAVFSVGLCVSFLAVFVGIVYSSLD
jgi:hypothetical protein